MPKTAEEIVKWAEDKELPPVADLCVHTTNLATTAERRRLLAVLCLPQIGDLSVLDLCAYAQIAPRTYYYAIHDDNFNNMQTKLARKLNASNTLYYRHKYHELASDKLDRQALERLNEQNEVLDKKETVVQVNVQESNKDIHGKTLAGLGAFDAEWEDVSDDKDISVAEVLVGAGGETDDSPPDSQPDQQDQGTVNDESDKTGDTMPVEGVRDERNTNEVLDNEAGNEASDSHPTGQDGSQQSIDGEVSRGAGSDAGQRSPDAPHSPGIG